MTATAATQILEFLASPGPPVEAKVMIVVPHPDDETIGMGAQLCRFRDSLLVQLTDGAPRDGRDAAAHGFKTISDYAFARRVELYTALEAGLAAGLRTEFIGVPDQAAVLNLVPLTKALGLRLQAEAPEAIFVQPYEGGHPDHDAASFAVHCACQLIEVDGKTPPAVIEMTAYHSNPTGLATGTFSTADQQITTLPLSPADRSRKRRMIDCFYSQRELLARFAIEFESFREAPAYDFTRPPHRGAIYYESLGWGINTKTWRQHAHSALCTLGLAPSCA